MLLSKIKLSTLHNESLTYITSTLCYNEMIVLNTIPEQKLRWFEHWVDTNLNASDSRNEQVCLWLATLLNAAKTHKKNRSPERKP